MPPVGAAIAALASSVGGLLAAGGWVGAVANFGASMLFSAVAQKLAGKPKFNGIESTQVSVAAPISPRDLAVGVVRKGAVLIFADTTGNSAGSTGTSMFHLVYAISAASCKSIGAVYFDDEMAFDAAGVATDRAKSGGAQRAWIVKKPSGDGSALTELMNWLPSKWTADHKLNDIAYIYVRLEYNATAFPSGIPNLTFDVEGLNNVYDPRSGQYVWTDNPALIIAHYIANEHYGLGAELDNPLGLNRDRVIAAANICDEVVNNPDGTTSKRYTFNGVIDLSMSPEELMPLMLTAMHGRLVRKGGQWHLYAGAYELPTIHLTEDDASGPLVLVPRLSMRENFNSVKGTFVSELNDWQPDDFPAYQSDVYITEDSGRVSWKDISLPFTTDPYAAQRIAKIELELARRQMSVEFPAKLSAMRASCGDTIMLTHPRWGFAAKPFMVTAVRFEALEGGVGVRPMLSLSEVSPLSYSFEASELQIYEAAPRTNLPSAWFVDDVGITSAIEELYVNKESEGVRNRVRITWDPSVSPNANRFVLQGSYEGGAWVDIADTRTGFAIHEGPSVGLWTYRLQGVSVLGAVSGWTSTSVTVAGLEAPPAALQGVTLQQAGGVAILKWDLPQDLDVLYGGRVLIRHSAIQPPSVVGSISMDEINGNTTIAIIPLLEGTYYLQTVDASGIGGPFVSAKTDGIQALDFAPLAVIQEDATFSGAKTGVIVEDGSLRLPVSGGLVPPSGLYVFATGSDLGSVKRVRLRAIVWLTSQVIGDTVDGRTPLVDTWDNWDSPAGADVDVLVEFRTTLDDPAGASPTWSTWGRLDSTEIRTRAIQGRATLMTRNEIAQPIVTRLRINIDEVS